MKDTQKQRILLADEAGSTTERMMISLLIRSWVPVTLKVDSHVPVVDQVQDLRILQGVSISLTPLAEKCGSLKEVKLEHTREAAEFL